MILVILFPNPTNDFVEEPQENEKWFRISKKTSVSLVIGLFLGLYVGCEIG